MEEGEKEKKQGIRITGKFTCVYSISQYNFHLSCYDELRFDVSRRNIQPPMAVLLFPVS